METILTPIDVTPDPELLKIIGAVAAAGKAYSKWLAGQNETVCYKENSTPFLNIERELDRSTANLIDLLTLKLQYDISE